MSAAALSIEDQLGPGLTDSSSVLALGQSLFPLFALALGLPETFFDDKVGVVPEDAGPEREVYR